MSRLVDRRSLLFAALFFLSGCATTPRDGVTSQASKRDSRQKDRKFNQEMKDAWREATGYNDPNWDRIRKREQPVAY